MIIHSRSFFPTSQKLRVFPCSEVVTCLPALRGDYLAFEFSLVAGFLQSYLLEGIQQSFSASVVTSSYSGLIPMLFRTETLKINTFKLCIGIYTHSSK